MALKTNLKRIGAWALCFMLLLSCIPVSADDGLLTTRDYSAGYSLDGATWAAASEGIYLGGNIANRKWTVPVYYYYLDAEQNPILSGTTQTLNINYNGNITISSVPSDIDGTFYGAKVATSASGEAKGPSTSDGKGIRLSASREWTNYTITVAPSDSPSNTTTVLSGTASNLTGSDYAVYVRYTPNTVTATFDPDNGSDVTLSTPVQPGDQITLPTTEPTREGYTFLGWKVEGDETLYRPEATYELSANTTFTAQWAENVELTYYRDDTLIHSQTSYVGAQIQLYYPEFNDLDERTVFDGWMDSNGDLVDPAGEELYTVTGAMRFTAHFTQGILVNLNPGTEGTFGDGVSIDVLIIPNGDTYGTWEDSFLLPDSTVEGKVFSHWVDDRGTVVTSSYVFTQDTTFTAVFIEQPLEIVGDSHYVLVGNTLQLQVIGTSEPVTWSSQNTDILTVDQNGLVTGVASGSTRVVAELEDGTTAEYIVTVVDGTYTISYQIIYPTDAKNFTMYGETTSLVTPVDLVLSESIDALPGSSYTLKDSTLATAVNYEIIGWKIVEEVGTPIVVTDATDSLIDYDVGETITVDGNLKLQAVWISNGNQGSTGTKLTVYYYKGSTLQFTDSGKLSGTVNYGSVQYMTDKDGNFIIMTQKAQMLNLGKTTGNTLIGYSLTDGSSNPDYKQGQVVTIPKRYVTTTNGEYSITLYCVFDNTNTRGCQFFILSPALSTGSSVSEDQAKDKTNWYFVGTGTVTAEAATITAERGGNPSSDDVSNLVETAPTIEQIMAVVGKVAEPGVEYGVRWYHYDPRQTDGYHIDGILYKIGVEHTIKYIDTYNNLMVNQITNIKDNTTVNILGSAPTHLAGTQNGLALDGWYYDPEGINKVPDGDIYIDSDVTVYAVYKNVYTVQFLDEEGNAYLDSDGHLLYQDYYQAVNSGSDAKYPDQEPTKPGYTFDGWYTQMGGQGTKLTVGSDLLKGISANAVYYAHFTRDTGTLKVSKVVQNEKGESIAALAGETFTFRIDGFDPGSTVHYTVSGDSTQHSATADSTLGEIELSIGANQTITFTDAQTGPYTVTERDVKKGTLTANGKTYTVASSTVSGTLDKERECTLSITNKRLEDFSITVRKVWEDGSNQDGKRAAVTINLMRSSNGGSAVQCDSHLFDGSQNTQDYSFQNVARYDADGNPYTYSVKEQGESNGTITLNGAEYSVEYSEVDGALVVTNSYTPETVDVNVTKTWDDFDDATGYRPNSERTTKNITLTLSASYAEDGQNTLISWSNLATSIAASQMIDQNSPVMGTTNQWKATWSGLPKYYNGHLITYTVSEDAVPHYSVTNDSVLSSTASSYDLSITNTIDLIDVTIIKKVTGNMGDANKSFNFEVSLYGANGTASISGASLSNKTTGDDKPTVTIDGATASFTLKHGQSVTLGGIPYGAQLGIKESGKTGYVATIGGVESNDLKESASYTEKVTIVPGTGKAQSITVTNDNTATIDTGVTLDFLPYVLLILGVGIAVALWLVMSANKRKDD